MNAGGNQRFFDLPEIFYAGPFQIDGSKQDILYLDVYHFGYVFGIVYDGVTNMRVMTLEGSYDKNTQQLFLQSKGLPANVLPFVLVGTITNTGTPRIDLSGTVSRGVYSPTFIGNWRASLMPHPFQEPIVQQGMYPFKGVLK
jgi:hypothetical protein